MNIVSDTAIDIITSEAMTWPQRASVITVLTEPTYRQAATMLQGIKALRTKIVETFGPHVKRAHEAHKALVGEQKAAEAPLLEAENTLKAKMVEYERAQEAIRLVEQRRLEALARAAAEERRLAEAVAAEEAGEADVADEILDEAPADIVVQVAPMTPKVDGISYRVTWAGELVDLAALVQHVSTHPEHIGLLAGNGPAINALARALKGALNVPGIRAVSKRDIAASGR